MLRTLIAVAAATALMGAASADAGSRHKHARGYHAYPAYAHIPQVGPIWAGPNQCWTDEGYGRYAVCSGRR
jgi:hypothetical protein